LLDQLESNSITKEQFTVLNRRYTMLERSYIHYMIIDKIEEDENFITYIQHVVTTKPREVNYGGSNKFTPLYLCEDKERGITLYTIPLTYINKVSSESFYQMFIKQQLTHYPDSQSLLLQKVAVTNLIYLMNLVKFRQVDIQADIINKSAKTIDPTEIFPYKDENYIVKP